MIRSATANDKPQILEMFRAIHKEWFSRPDTYSGITFEYDPEAMSELFRRHQRPDACCFVYEVDGVARGVMLGTSGRYILGPAKIAEETFIYVEPEFRGRAVFKLIAAFEEWAKSQGCVAITMSTKPDDRVEALYTRLGYRTPTTYYVKSQKDAAECHSSPPQ